MKLESLNGVLQMYWKWK